VRSRAYAPSQGPSIADQAPGVPTSLGRSARPP
jgi:hypothetical protein